jgi:hypothetical protein
MRRRLGEGALRGFPFDQDEYEIRAALTRPKTPCSIQRSVQQAGFNLFAEKFPLSSPVCAQRLQRIFQLPAIRFIVIVSIFFDQTPS